MQKTKKCHDCESYKLVGASCTVRLVVQDDGASVPHNAPAALGLEATDIVFGQSRHPSIVAISQGHEARGYRPFKSNSLEIFGKRDNVQSMESVELIAPEFGFVSDLPAWHKTRLGAFVSSMEAIRRATKENGLLVPPALAAGILNVSPQRVNELINDGRLKRIEIGGKPFVTENSMEAFVREERKNGRPYKGPVDAKGTWKVAREFAASEMKK